MATNPASAPSLVPRRDEVLRYLGYGGQELGPELEDALGRVSAEAAAQIRCRWRWRVFPLGRTAEGLSVEGTVLTLGGRDIARHLEGCSQVALMAVTAGTVADREVARRRLGDAVGALIYDACATDMVERAADACQGEILRHGAAAGLRGTGRFSPGYGDLPLEIQGDFLRVVDPMGSLGITLTPELLMVPMKSVTAVVGLGIPEVPATKPAVLDGPCVSCPAAPHCPLRRAGTPCGTRKE